MPSAAKLLELFGFLMFHGPNLYVAAVAKDLPSLRRTCSFS
jgi:hypothetical protein